MNGGATRLARVLACLLALACAEQPSAQESPPLPPAGQPPPPPPPESAPPEKRLSDAELEQLTAPIALYPDDLVAQVLMASTYPLEIVEAARWVKKPENAKLKSDALDKSLASQSWDDSVKSLTHFPQVLQNMDEKLDWTQRLGDAFLADQKAVMDSIQRLRRRAQDAGNLKSNEQQTVTTETATNPETQAKTEVIIIQPANPQVVYVPTYQPTVVYGAWPYPAYPPYYYPAPPGAYFTAGFFWGAAITAGFAYWGGAHCGWGGGDVDVDVNKNVDINRNTDRNKGDRGQGGRGQGDRGQGGRGPGGDRGQGGKWKHDPSHRKGVNYANASTREKYGRGQSSNAAARDQFRGREGGAGQRPSTGMGAGGAGVSDRGRGTSGSVGERPGSRPGGGRESVGSAGTRESVGSSRSGGGAFDRSGGGSAARASSARGNSSFGGSRGGGAGGGSRGGGGRGGGGRGGGRR